jgi:pyrroloquinoline-quinone synthase
VNFWDRLADVRAENDVLKHPFYVRWSAGELSGAELACYAGEYRHAVVALADAADGAARAATPALRPELERHATEEREHVGLWDEFAHAVGADPEAAPLRETVLCSHAWAGDADRPLLETLVALHAIEAAQPEISRTKLAGLRDHYGVQETSYFELHVERDVEHAREGRAMIETQLDSADQERLLEVAEGVLRANWRLLDGVERAAAG